MMKLIFNLLSNKYLISFFYTIAGLNHFIMPDFYIKMMPNYLPLHYELVILSGMIEVLLGLGILFTQTKRLAAWGIILLLLAVYPANINMLVNHETMELPLWVLVIRLPIQFLFIGWAYIFTKD